MTTGQLITVIASFVATMLFGGVAGALLKYLFDKRMSSIQRIGLWKNVDTIAPEVKTDFVKATITLSAEGGKQTRVETFSVVKVTLGNTSSYKDYDRFVFGITFPEDVSLFNIKEETPDPNHAITYSPSEDDPKPRSSQQIELAPFNREDLYSITLAVVPTESQKSEIFWFRTNSINNNNVVVSTPMVGVRFKYFNPQGYEPSSFFPDPSSVLTTVILGIVICCPAGWVASTYLQTRYGNASVVAGAYYFGACAVFIVLAIIFVVIKTKIDKKKQQERSRLWYARRSRIRPIYMIDDDISPPMRNATVRRSLGRARKDD